MCTSDVTEFEDNTTTCMRILTVYLLIFFCVYESHSINKGLSSKTVSVIITLSNKSLRKASLSGSSREQTSYNYNLDFNESIGASTLHPRRGLSLTLVPLLVNIHKIHTTFLYYITILESISSDLLLLQLKI